MGQAARSCSAWLASLGFASHLIADLDALGTNDDDDDNGAKSVGGLAQTHQIVWSQ